MLNCRVEGKAAFAILAYLRFFAHRWQSPLVLKPVRSAAYGARVEGGEIDGEEKVAANGSSIINLSPVSIRPAFFLANSGTPNK